MHTIPITTDSAASWDWPLQHNDGVVKVTNTSEKFEVGLDAGFFGPNDIDVKVNGIEIIIHLRHDVSFGTAGAVYFSRLGGTREKPFPCIYANSTFIIPLLKYCLQFSEGLKDF